MENIKQLLNRDNWLDYLRMAREGGLTDVAIANDIAAKIDKALRDEHSQKVDLDHFAEWHETRMGFKLSKWAIAEYKKWEIPKQTD